jgi:Flp pilus assembly protein TadG
MRRFADAATTFRNQRGSALIMVALSLLVVTALAGIAIDGAIMMTTKTQLQRAADAAALAGASGLIDGDEDLAMDRAIAMASYNTAMQDAGSASVVITEDDISFPEPDVIRVVTHRTAATGDGLRMFFRRVVDTGTGNTADVTAVAVARAFDLCTSRCLKPWSVPDRWDDADDDGEYDAGESYSPEVTGYAAPGDVGRQITLKVSEPSETIASGIFFPVDFPPLGHEESPLTGANWYRHWIAECEPYTVTVGDRLQVEPGNKVGPTRQGMDDLIALDPAARWDPTTRTIVGSTHAMSPRIALIAMFDPTEPPRSGRNWVEVSKLAAMFIEATGPGGEVVGRFIDTSTQGNPCPGGGLANGFLKGVTLVE